MLLMPKNYSYRIIINDEIIFSKRENNCTAYFSRENKELFVNINDDWNWTVYDKLKNLGISQNPSKFNIEIYKYDSSKLFEQFLVEGAWLSKIDVPYWYPDDYGLFITFVYQTKNILKGQLELY